MGMRNKWKILGDESILYVTKKNGDVWEAIVDTYDLYRLFILGVTWSGYGKNKENFYLHANINGKHTSLHRHIMNNPQDMHIDHINGMTQDNRRSNMRIVTHAQNMQNRNPLSNNKSGMRGVGYHKADQKWTAELTVNGNYMYLGTFQTKEAANERVVAVRKEYMPYSAREVI